MKIHRYWQGEPHPMVDWTRLAIRTTHPGHELREWGPEDFHVNTDDARHAGNMARYQVLFEFGGLWLDHDVVPLTDLTVLHDEPWIASLADRYEGCAMFFPEPRHPALVELITRSCWPEAAGLSAPIRSGSYLINDVLRDHSIRMEPRVLPFDAHGRATGVEDPIAVHVWDSSRKSGTSTPGTGKVTATLGG